MARKRKSGDAEEAAAIECAPAAAIGGARGAQKRFVGVRQRPSGRWVAEIKDTIQKIRVWLGTFDTAEDAARAYDEAACLLRGANTRTNFWPCSPSQPSAAPALPSKITNILLLRLRARQGNSSLKSHEQTPLQHPHQQNSYEQSHNSNIQFPDFLSVPNSITTCSDSGGSNYLCDGVQAGCAEVDGAGFFEWGYGVDGADNSVNCSGESREVQDEAIEDFGFLDPVEDSSAIYSPFEIAEEMEGQIENGYHDLDDVRADMKRMKYERKISASFYALNGISECLKLRNGGAKRGEGVSSHLSKLRSACQKQEIEGEVRVGGARLQIENTQSPIQIGTSYLSASSSLSSSSSAPMITVEGEDDDLLSLWSSLDLPPICFVS